MPRRRPDDKEKRHEMSIFFDEAATGRCGEMAGLWAVGLWASSTRRWRCGGDAVVMTMRWWWGGCDDEVMVAMRWR